MREDRIFAFDNEAEEFGLTPHGSRKLAFTAGDWAASAQPAYRYSSQSRYISCACGRSYKWHKRQAEHCCACGQLHVRVLKKKAF